MKAFFAYFHAPVRAVRAYAFSRIGLAMVALDTWLLMIGHAGRYGVDGFNVAHFAWLDRLLPVPSATAYVTTLLAAGLLALTLTLAGPHPSAVFALFLLYTLSWSMSMLDSYQHHYFVSSLLLCLVFFPRLTIADVVAAPPEPEAARPRAKAKNPEAQPKSTELRYVLPSAAAIVLYALVDAPSHPWLLFLPCAGTLVVATFVSARACRAQLPRLATGFGYNLLGATVGVVYTFTSIAKMDAQWCEGHTIQRISSAGKVFAPLAALAGEIGISDARFWSLLSTGVIPLELTVALGYFVAVLQDEHSARWLRRFVLLAFWLAIGLHVGAEAMGLEIGWFSYYMMLLACTYLLPGPAIEALARVLTLPAQLCAAQLAELEDGETGKGQSLTMLLAVALLLWAAAYLIDLPGAYWAAALGVFGLAVLCVYALRSGQLAALRRTAIATGCAATLMWATIAWSPVRWDFYRFLGGDLSRRGQDQAALEAYVHGERYAPKGQSRRDKIDELRRRLGR